MATSHYQAMAVAPAEIEHAVVNLLRLHEAEIALLFCATRDNVRRLHSSLTERGFNAVALSGEHSQNERNQALQALRDGRARVLVATDVAARGIDLPNLIAGRPCRAAARRRDAAAPLRPHRPRRQEGHRRARRPLSAPQARRDRCCAARGSRPSGSSRRRPRTSRRSDRERLLAALLAPVEIDDEDRALAPTPARATSRPRRSPPPWSAPTAPACRRAEELADGAAPTASGRAATAPRPGFEDTIWFRMDIGRRHNADPRWLLPLLCRRGHITKNEIGAIRIAANETMFEVPRAVAGKLRRRAQAHRGRRRRRRRRRPDRGGRGQAARRRARESPSRAAAGPAPGQAVSEGAEKGAVSRASRPLTPAAAHPNISGSARNRAGGAGSPPPGRRAGGRSCRRASSPRLRPWRRPAGGWW